jgi:hypothetical protein
MIDFRSHRVWMWMLVLAVVIGAGGSPALNLARQKAEQTRISLLKENEKSEQALRQLRDDIAAAEKMKTVIDDDAAKKSLAAVDRLRAAQILEQRAAEANLTRFAYTVSPEEKTFIDTVGAGRQELATSKWTVTADAPTDIDVFVFLDAISHTLPGRVTLRALSIQRIGENEALISDANVHLTANGEWLSNGASRNLAEHTR